MTPEPRPDGILARLGAWLFPGFQAEPRTCDPCVDHDHMSADREGAGTMTELTPEAAEQEAYAEYLAAWCDLANMPSASERSVDQEAAAQQAESRLRQAEMAHLDACLVAHPERQAHHDAAEAARAFTISLSPSEFEVWSHGDRTIPDDADAWREANAREIVEQVEFDQELEWNIQRSVQEREAEMDEELELMTLEPDLGPTPESIEQGAEPDDAYRSQDAVLDAEAEAEMDEHSLGVYDGQPVMEGHHGRLVYDCGPQTLDGCLLEVPADFLGMPRWPEPEADAEPEPCGYTAAECEAWRGAEAEAETELDEELEL